MILKYLKLPSRLLLGTVFIFSGFVKAVDPLGYAYKISDYFTAFRMEFLHFSSLPLSILVSCFEILLGITLILGYRRRISYVVLLFFMGFFTVLTFILAIFNPVHDCGCFGDALILTNWETFLKNVVLMIFVLVLYSQRKNERSSGNPLAEWVLLTGIYVAAILFSVWNYRHIPLLDFRPYEVGTHIADEMRVPEGAPVDQYETTLVYKNLNSGKEKEFTIEDYPKDTTEWSFVSSDSRLISKGYEPPIHDFAIMDTYGEDLVDQILSDPGYSLFMVSYNLGKADPEALVKAGDWARMEILAEDYHFYPVTASPGAEVEAIKAELGLDYDFLAGDEIMLKTIVRSNPGFMLVANGSIVGKWGYRDFPGLENLDPTLGELLDNASSPMDEETQMLIEAGIMEDFSFAVLEFESLLPRLIYQPRVHKMEKSVVLAYVLALVVLVLLSHLIVRIKA